MVNLLGSALGSSKNLIIYPAKRADSVHTVSEYTLDTDQVTASNAIREITTWDTSGYTNSFRNGLAAGQGSRKYFFVIQQGTRTPISTDDQDHIDHRINRIEDSIENCLDPGLGQDPWQNSFSFWNGWPPITENDDVTLREITNAEQQRYMDEVKEALT